MTKRIGFACKWIDTAEQVNGIGAKDSAKQYNTGTTTITWLNRQTKDVAYDKLWSLMKDNIEATRKLVAKVGGLNEQLRMVRIGSDILAAYTHSDWRDFYLRQDVRAYAEKHFATIGDTARSNNVRISFHPGQFCVLASANDNIVVRSIEEFEYHTDMARWMGYGKTFHDHGFKINVHISGKRGPQGIRDVWQRLTPEARNLITIENEEISYGLDDAISLADILPIVMDVHHHWIHSNGEYISPSDPRVQRVVESWRGNRPTMHFSCSREDILVGASTSTSPDLSTLLLEGHKKQKLRAHSDFYWNTEVNDWALTFWDKFDIMCESKAKNLASQKLYERALQLNI
jgi:UV DNA damage repair endonuclease